MQTKTKQYDEEATKYLSYVLYPLVRPHVLLHLAVTPLGWLRPVVASAGNRRSHRARGPVRLSCARVLRANSEVSNRIPLSHCTLTCLCKSWAGATSKHACVHACR